MATVSLTDYASQQAEIARRQKLADMLSQQGQQDIPIQSYNGTQAPIPWTAILAKALQTGVGAYMSRRASDQQDKATTGSHAALLAALNGPDASAPAGPVASTPPVQPQMSQAAPPQDAGPTFDPNGPAPGENVGVTGPSPQNVAAALQSDPTAAPQGPPPQAMAAALGGQPPQQAPMPQPAAQAPPVAAPADPLDATLAQKQAEVRRLTVAALSPALSPADRATMFTQVKTAQEAVTEIQKEKFKQLAEESKRQAQTARTINFINTAPGLSPEMKATLTAGAPADPDLAKTIGAQMVKDAFTKKLVPATPQDLQGYPQGTVAQKDPMTGKLENIYNPIPNQMAIANERLHAQEVGISAHNSARADAEFKARQSGGGSPGGQWGLSPEESAVLAQAAKEGRIDVTRLNSRTAKIQAGILMAVPGFDAVNNHSFAAVAGNANMQQKAMMANMLPEVLNNVREAGKKMGFSRFQPIGHLQAMGAAVTNDPKYIAYMSQRNDAVQTLAQVMSGVGATDMRTKMESEAAPKTMSPDAWDAWYAGQLKALQPRIEKYNQFHITAPAGRGGVAAPPHAMTDAERLAKYGIH